MLENFRAQKIIWDRANKKIFETIEANSGDSNGRKLVVQIINREATESLLGTTLSLGWKHRNGAKGLDAFNLVDASKGIFEIYYTTEMLSNIGNLEASLILIDSTSRIESSTFTISVRPSTVDDESVESENSFTALTEALVKVNDFETRLAQTVKQGEVSVLDIDKNKGLIDETYLSDTLKQQMAGTTPIHTVPADDSITLKKTTFQKVGKNLFDKKVATSGYYVNHLNGNLDASAPYYASDFIPVSTSENYTLNKSYWIAFYDADKNFVSGINTLSGAKSTITIPANAVYLRASIHNTLLDTFQIELGNEVTTYEPFYRKIPHDYLSLPPFDPDEIPNGSVTKEMTNFITVGKNKFDKSKATDGYINQANGTLDVTTAYKASDFIAVTPNTQYSFTTGAAVRIAYYDNAKKFISGALNPTIPVTTPTNAAYVRYSFTANQIDSQQFEEGSAQTEYQPFGYVIKDGIYREIKQSDQFEVDAVIAPSIPAIVGKELNIYFENIMNDRASNYQIDVKCSIGQQQEERWTVIPTTAGTYSMTINIYKNYSLIKTISTSIVVKSTSVGNAINKKLLIIGDSTTANSIMANELNSLFSSDVMDITFLGTKGTAPVLHEGISGWTTDMFYSNETSPFVFNGVFDFSQYMTTNGYVGTDYVVINLGVNDMFTYNDDANANHKIEEVLAQYQSIINNIKSYNANIKIGLAVTIPPNYSQDAFGKDYGSSQTRWRYKRNNFLWAKALISQYKGKEAQNIYLVPINVNIDTEHNFETSTVPVNSRNSTTVVRSATNSGVHPSPNGYYQIADLYYYWLKSQEV